MMRISIVGCGKIADQHLDAIERIPGCRVVAVCDLERRMAGQLAERYGVPEQFESLDAMLDRASPDVVHVTTPPQSHFSVGEACLRHGCHVYLEKPFAVNEYETARLLRLAEDRRLKITAGHNLQFTNEMIDMRRLVAEGALGGSPIHIESHFSYSLDDASYITPLLGSASHWVRRLPGQLFHNVISHGIARLAEFLPNEALEVTARAFQSDELRRLGGGEIRDELRVLIRTASGVTGYFCFSTQLRPGLNSLRVCGPGGTVFVDLGSGSVVRHPLKSDKSYLAYFLPPARLAAQWALNGGRNLVRFVRRQLYQDFGMTALIERFYRCIREDLPPPIPHHEILATARIMDRIFEQIDARHDGAQNGRNGAGREWVRREPAPA